MRVSLPKEVLMHINELKGMVLSEICQVGMGQRQAL